MSVRLAQGSKEFVLYDVQDLTGVITDLTGTSPQFDVDVEDTDGAEAQGTSKINNQAASLGSDKMVLQCLVDTNSGSGVTPWPKGLYYVYVFWTIGSEVPREGPFELYVT